MSLLWVTIEVGDSGESKSADPKGERGFSEKSQSSPCVLHAFLSMIDKACLPLSRGMELEWKATGIWILMFKETIKIIVSYWLGSDSTNLQKTHVHAWRNITRISFSKYYVLERVGCGLIRRIIKSQPEMGETNFLVQEGASLGKTAIMNVRIEVLKGDMDPLTLLLPKSQERYRFISQTAWYCLGQGVISSTGLRETRILRVFQGKIHIPLPSHELEVHYSIWRDTLCSLDTGVWSGEVP